MSLEHLLRAIIDEPQARGLLTTCGVNLETLRKQVDEVLAKAFTPVPAPGSVEPDPSVGFDRVVQQAVVHAAVSSAKQVDSGSLLVFMLQEEESHAAFFLQSQGLDRLTLLRVISHGGRGQAAPQPAASPAPAHRRPRIRSKPTRPTSSRAPPRGRSIRSSDERSSSSG